MEKLDIIEFDEKEYLVYDKIEWQQNFYYVLCPVKNERVEEESIVVKEKDGLLYSLETEDEIKAIKEILETKMKNE